MKPIGYFDIQNEDDFNEKVLNCNNPVLVGFYAPWCESCRVTMPKLEKVVEENDGKIRLAKVNIDDKALQDLAIKYNFKSVPVTAVIKDGKLRSQLVGKQELENVRQFVQSTLNE
ncbi:hypothetical protein PVAND_000183 [Polypedilum vanderplanki]